MSIRSLELSRECTGYHKMDNISAARSCSGVGSIVMLQAETQSVRYRLDGQDPTATEGFLITAGTVHTINVGDGNIPNIKVIQASSGAILHVHAFR